MSGPVKPIDSGHYSSAFRFEHQKTSYTLRLSPKQEHFHRDKLIFEKYGHELPVAEILAVGRFELGKYFCVSRALNGHKLAETTTANNQQISSFMQQLTRISKVDIKESVGYGRIMGDGGEFDSWESFLEGWDESTEAGIELEEQIKAGYFDRGLINEAKAALTTLSAATYEKRHLIHGDFQLHNILFQNNIISAVLDWGNAKYGDFAYDIVWTSMHPPRVTTEAELVDIYAISGLDVTNIKDRIRAVKISIYIGWAIFSNEIGHYEESSKNQADLGHLLRN